MPFFNVELTIWEILILAKGLIGQLLVFLHTHSEEEPDLGLMNCLKSSEGTQMIRPTFLTTPNVQSNHRTQVFENNQFFPFIEAQKTYF